MSSPPSDRRISALPSPMARALAFAAILLGGLCGALLGYAVVDVQCNGSCGGPNAIGAIIGAVMGAVGVGVLAVLALRAMAEWRAIDLTADRRVKLGGRPDITDSSRPIRPRPGPAAENGADQESPA